ncbi:MAG: tRNA lysidine(34) synthetase TilS, partial [Candidatus Omnitrophica bacterium]|nr:tRNA lysidine(34) synthetase TilS [Candidatus Omnitrophota bacterium]
LLEIRKTLNIKIMVANMDHCLRGIESANDSRFVEKLSMELGLKFIHKKVDVKKKRDKKKSIEETAREERYGFLENTARMKNCNVIATGHTMDDQAETVLMRIIYGASLAGIVGIPAVRDADGVRIVRPLINSERQDIIGFLKSVGFTYVEDKSNFDTKFVRNSTRHEIIPFLEKYNPKIKRTLSSLAESLREDYLFLSLERAKRLKKYGNITSSVKIKDVLLQPKAMRKEIFKELFKKAGGTLKKLTHRHWKDMDYFLAQTEKGKSLDMPGGVKICKQKGEIVFRKHGQR